MGAAYWVHNQVLGNDRSEPYTSSYLGPEFSDQEILKQLQTAKLPFR